MGAGCKEKVRETSLLSDLQFPRHLTEGAGQTKGEGRPVLPDGALDAVALAHAGAQGVQASGQVGRAAALAEVVGDAAGEAQGGEGAAQTDGHVVAAVREAGVPVTELGLVAGAGALGLTGHWVGHGFAFHVVVHLKLHLAGSEEVELGMAEVAAVTASESAQGVLDTEGGQGKGWGTGG